MSRITPHIDIPKRRLLLNAFFMSQFSYCPLVWMCHRRSKNLKVNHRHERYLMVIYCDKSSTFEEMFLLRYINEIYNSWQLKRLKLHKIVHPLFLKKIRKRKKEEQNIYNLRNTTEFNTPLIKIVYNGLESFS